MTRLSFCAGAALVLASGLICGCSEGGPERFPVKGVVTFNGETVPRGWVVFVAEDKQKETAAIGADGGYEAALPVGKYQVGITAPREMTATGMDAFKAETPPPYVPVRFGIPENSGLGATVEAVEENTIDFPLELKRRRRRR